MRHRLVERRDKGGWFRTDYRLYMNGRDRTKLVDGVARQLDAVRLHLPAARLEMYAALAFVDAEWKLLAKPFQLDGVWVVWS